MEAPSNVRTSRAIQTAETIKTRRGGLAFVLATVFLDMLGAAILIPVQAYIVRLYNTDALAVSMLSVIYSAAQFGAAPILGWLSDRYGRRPWEQCSAWALFWDPPSAACWVSSMSSCLRLPRELCHSSA